jgi:hypothetical protein
VSRPAAVLRASGRKPSPKEEVEEFAQAWRLIQAGIQKGEKESGPQTPAQRNLAVLIKQQMDALLLAHRSGIWPNMSASRLPDTVHQILYMLGGWCRSIPDEEYEAIAPELQKAIRFHIRRARPGRKQKIPQQRIQEWADLLLTRRWSYGQIANKYGVKESVVKGALRHRGMRSKRQAGSSSLSKT